MGKKGVGEGEQVVCEGRSYSQRRRVVSKQGGKPFENPSPGTDRSLADLPEDKDLPHLPGLYLEPGALGDVRRGWDGHRGWVWPWPARRSSGITHPGLRLRSGDRGRAVLSAACGRMLRRPGEEAVGIPGRASSCPAAAGGPAWLLGCSPRSGDGICKCSALPGTAMV